jgi:hypothetical protein
MDSELVVTSGSTVNAISVRTASLVSLISCSERLSPHAFAAFPVEDASRMQAARPATALALDIARRVAGSVDVQHMTKVCSGKQIEV